MVWKKRGPVVIAVLVIALVAIWYRWPETPPPLDLSGPTADWPEWGNDAGGQRFSPLTQINRENVRFLELAWEHHSGDVSDGGGDIPSTTAYQLTPILVDGTMYGCSPFNRVFALDPETGEEIWSFDPESDLANTRPANLWICRGVAHWLDPELGEGQEPGEVPACRRRIYTATNDARLIALDAATGEPCQDFGDDGQVDLTRGVGSFWWEGEYQVTSAPTVIHDLVVVGSAVGDNQRVDAPSGAVRAYDARSGEMRWAWDPVTPEYRERHPKAPPDGAEFFLGTPNVWGMMSADTERDLLFLPTGNSSPDYYGGHRDGIDEYASSVVALHASTGAVVWYFQTVHHDLWDYDVAAQPTLTTVVRDGQELPAVVQTTKMGLIFVLHRETGEPIFPVEERPVPQDGVAGEVLSPTQPFPVQPPALVPHALSPDRAWGLTPWQRSECRELIESLRFDGIYTPPSLQGSIMYPGN
ncbi:MAG: PQQ-binding-like beta-propeller repeat protein, partial [Acidobacteriota bacterium]